MTENEAIKRMRYRIDTATDIVGKGVDGKVYEDMEIAIKALEEIQQYRSIGTVDDFERLVYLKERYENETYDYCGEYGTEECPKAKEIQQYQAIGTVDECREVRKKQERKKPNGRYKTRYVWDSAYCPVCGCGITARWNFCQSCGQAIDWSE